MTRITSIEPAQAQGKARDLLDAVQQAMGATPNIFTAMANSPAALEGLLVLNGSLGNGSLNPQLREKLALTVAGENGCDYCASAHTFLGEKSGLEANELVANLQGKSGDAKDNAALVFAKKVIDNRGRVSKSELDAARDAGFSNEDIIEIIAHVALNTFTNYFNEAFQVEIDFPKVSTESSLKVA